MVFVSIIIPFNKGKIYLEECLNSLKNQNIKNEEIILILNGVKENLNDLIENYSKLLPLKIRKFEKEIGVAKARNEGIKIASGKYVYFMDSDDYLYSNALDKLINVAKISNSFDIINGERIHTYFSSEPFNNVFKSANFKLNLQNDMSDEEYGISMIMPKENDIRNISVLNSLIKRNIILEKNFEFDENLKYYSDYSFIFPILESNEFKIKGVEKAIYVKRKRDDPTNFPSLDQEDPENQFLHCCESYLNSLKYLNLESSLKISFDKKMLNYYINNFSPKIRRNPEEKWRTTYFEKMSEVSKKFHEKSVKWYQRQEINALKNKDIKTVKKYLKFRLIYRKIKLIIKDPKKVDRHIYMNIFNKLQIKENMLIFESMRGAYYNDSPKHIYEYLYKNHKDEFKFIWVLNNKKSKESVLGSPKTVKRFSLLYYYYIAISKYWIINMRQPLRLRKRNDQKIISTWHGTPLKKLGMDIDTIHSADPKIKKKYVANANEWEYLVSANSYSSKIFRSAFKYNGKILECGYPRNDLLYNTNQNQIDNIKKKLNLPTNKKVILYAPTWRDDEYHDIGQYKFHLKLDLNRLAKEISENYILLIRTHYLISDTIDLTEHDRFAFNVTEHDDIGELCLISDMLITDYSSVFFDYANLRRPILFYTYDLEKYGSNLRGFYIDMKKDVPGPLLFTTEEVINAIKNIDKINLEFKEKYEEFYNKFCYLDDGHASERISKKIFKIK